MQSNSDSAKCRQTSMQQRERCSARSWAMRPLFGSKVIPRRTLAFVSVSVRQSVRQTKCKEMASGPSDAQICQINGWRNRSESDIISKRMSEPMKSRITRKRSFTIISCSAPIVSVEPAHRSVDHTRLLWPKRGRSDQRPFVHSIRASEIDTICYR